MAFLAKLSSGRANFSCNVPLENALRRLPAGLGNLPFQSTLSGPEAPLQGAFFFAM